MWVTPNDGKAPILDDWPNLRLDEDGTRRSFGSDHNVGASDLADLDFDDRTPLEAYRALAPPELVATAEFEHAGRPHLIVSSEGVQTRKFKRADGSMLLELRGEGAQTVFPPSIHPDGLTYDWVNDGEPREVEAGRLQVIAAMIATVAYASEFWSVGSRHDLALALAPRAGARQSRRRSETAPASSFAPAAPTSACRLWRRYRATSWVPLSLASWKQTTSGRARPLSFSLPWRTPAKIRASFDEGRTAGSTRRAGLEHLTSCRADSMKSAATSRNWASRLSVAAGTSE